MRVVFYKYADEGIPIQAVYCQDYYRDEIEAEKDLPAEEQFWTNEFNDNNGIIQWICPNTKSVSLLNAT